MELKEAVVKIKEEKKTLEIELGLLLSKFTIATGLTVYSIDPNAIYDIKKLDEPMSYEPRIELIVEK